MPPVRMRGDGRKAKNPRKTLLRLLGYMKPYLPTLGVVLLCIIANAVAQTTGSRSLGTLVDSYILPMVRDGSTDFSSLWGYLSKLACIFAVGMISSFLFMFLMVKVSQGTQKHIRDEMFAHMQTLPLRYFDTNTAGNIITMCPSKFTPCINSLSNFFTSIANYGTRSLCDIFHYFLNPHHRFTPKIQLTLLSILYTKISTNIKNELCTISTEFIFLTGDFLSSQAASSQVLSTFKGLTTVFGMGTGGSP